MDTIDIKIFIAVAKTLNITKAAQQLHCAQSTISTRLKALEAELGTTLIDRGQGMKSLNLTSTGEEFYDLAQKITSLTVKANELKFQNSKLSLSMGTLNSINYALFPPLYHALSQHRPKLNLNIMTSHSQQIYTLVENRQIDVGFALIERSLPDVVVEKFHSEPMVLIRKFSSKYSPSKIFHPHELDPQNELYLSSEMSYKIWHDKWWSPLETECIHLDASQLIVSLMYSEEQWAIIPFSSAKKALSEGNFNIYRLADTPPDREYFKVTHKYPKASTLQSLEILDYYLKRCLQNLPRY